MCGIYAGLGSTHRISRINLGWLHSSRHLPLPTEQGASTAHLEQFLILAKTARGSAIVELIKQVEKSMNVCLSQ